MNETEIDSNCTAKTFLSGEIARQLDFYRIREAVASLCISEEGKEQLLTREPSADEKEINTLKDMGREWNTYIHSSRKQAVSSWPPIAKIIPILGVEGAALLQEQIFALGLFCLSSCRAQDSITSASLEMPLPKLSLMASNMPSLKQAQNLIFSIIDTSGELKDLPTLRAIRAKISSLQKEIENSIRKYTSNSALNNVLQSNVPAYRADRQLLAVRADKRNEIQGIIHEVSASGQTVYIEPDEVVRANNDLIQAEFELEAEKRKIFKELTENLGSYKEDFSASLNIMMQFDVTFATARYQSDTHGIFAETADLSVEPADICKARHPLLAEKAVPVDIHFHDGKNILIITGPNTGGKTVTLKTVALFALMNQAGFPIPAAEGTRLPIFNGVFADIGDEQSIDESLSTFSSHMKNIAFLLNHADAKSLVLLDELGSGTDPQEGGAIGMAVLDSLIQKKAFVLVTTHHGILKNYGYTHESCINASVEFDTTNLTPTYRLLMGVPGESHALDIAQRSGLPEKVVQQARTYISTEQADVSTLIKGLTAKHTELDGLLQEELKSKAQTEEKAFRLEQKEIALKEREIELKDMEHRKSTEFLEQTRSSLENLIREIREGEITREKTLASKQFINNLTDKVNSQNDSLEKETADLTQQKINAEKEEARLTENGILISKAKSHSGATKKNKKGRVSSKEAFANATPLNFVHNDKKKKSSLEKELTVEDLFVPGTEVLVGPSKRNGILLNENKKGVWGVQFGSLKMNVPQSQIFVVKSKSEFKNTPSFVIETESGRGSSNNESERPKFELRLLGMRCDEAMRVLEKQLDACAICNFKNFSIIHGKGAGILQQAVQDYLSHYPGVKEFHFAPPEDGGTGKTYVTLI